MKRRPADKSEGSIGEANPVTDAPEEGEPCGHFASEENLLTPLPALYIFIGHG